LAQGLAARGVEVVSGGARGIDTCAHLGALEERGRTVAVLGSGFLHPYPPENADLFERIAASGAVMTEFALDQGPHPENFPRRNRLISGLAAGVVVVEAGTRSGSLGTAALALDQGREVMAVPGPVSSAQSVGCNRLIQDGAKLVQNVDDVLGELSPRYKDAVRSAAEIPAQPSLAFAEGTPDENAVAALLDEVEPLHVDELAERAPFGIARLQAALFGLELRGAIEQHPGRYFTRRADGRGST
jgi:DNA processing protein